MCRDIGNLGFGLVKPHFATAFPITFIHLLLQSLPLFLVVLEHLS